MDLFGIKERIIAEALQWDHVSIHQSRSGSTEIRLLQQTFAYLHRDSRMDLLMPKQTRIELVFAGLAEPHPTHPTSGWVTVYPQDLANEELVIRMLKNACELMQDQLLSRSKRSRHRLTQRNMTIGETRLGDRETSMAKT